MSVITQAYAARKETFKLKPQHARDSYKFGHPDQYPDNTQYVYTNYTPRSDRLSGIPKHLMNGKMVWMGIQGTLMEYVNLWQEQFFDKPLEEILAAWINRVPAFTGEDKPDTSRIEALHKLGYLPLHVKALQEGSRVNIGVPCFTIVNTHPDFGWLTNSTETYLSNETWKMPTIATIAYAYRQLLDSFAEMTGTPQEFVDWQGHCFADRGMSGMIDAAKHLSGHSVAFLGSDSVSTVDWLDWAYYAEGSFVSGSVPATEHAVMCMGEKLGEKDTIVRLITKIYSRGIVSIVSDTWDFWNTISVTALELKDVIMARQPNALGQAKVVFRPDSGCPVKVLTGWIVYPGDTSAFKTVEEALDYVKEELWTGGAQHVYEAFMFDGKYFELDYECEGVPRELREAEVKGAVQVLWEIFGGTLVEPEFSGQFGKPRKQYKMLDSHVGLIYGDSITLARAQAILERLADKDFASGNVVLGIGSYTYQYITRDTLGNALKATYGVVDGVGREIFKDPVTDIGKTKKSAKGLLRVEKVGDDFVLYDQQTPEQEKQGELKTVLLDGVFPNLVDFKTVRGVLGAVAMNV